jgi:predicted Zn finger-like uncharacterized protein
MRLICPNCDAQYEVDDAAIPPTGRDVQCSSCGHAWFQMHADAMPDSQPDASVPADPAGSDLSAAMWSDAGVDTPDNPADIEGPADEGPPPVLPDVQEAAGLRRRGLDDTVLAVLREEAAREAAVRRTEAPPAIEMQTDLGLAPPPPALSPSVLAARERFADLSVSPNELSSDGELAARPASRRELLPDIEEINSTLRASSEPRGDGAEAQTKTYVEADRRGFRTGFVMMILIAVLFWSVYVMAPRIVAAVPASERAMKIYVDGVDRARLGVDAALQSASRSLRSLSGLDGQDG